VAAHTAIVRGMTLDLLDPGVDCPRVPRHVRKLCRGQWSSPVKNGVCKNCSWRCFWLGLPHRADSANPAAVEHGWGDSASIHVVLHTVANLLVCAGTKSATEIGNALVQDSRSGDHDGTNTTHLCFGAGKTLAWIICE
jgi:hypothetical protein